MTMNYSSGGENLINAACWNCEVVAMVRTIIPHLLEYQHIKCFCPCQSLFLLVNCHILLDPRRQEIYRHVKTILYNNISQKPYQKRGFCL